MNPLSDRHIAVATLALAFALFTGCTNPGANQPATVTGTPPAADKGAASAPSTGKLVLNLPEPAIPAAAIPSAPAKKSYRIAISLLTRDDDFYKTLEEGLKDEAVKQKVEVSILSGDKDLNKQINQVQNFVAQKFDAIVLCPVDSQGILSAVVAANSAGIPVFTADIASKGGKVVCHVASDNVQGGRLVGEYAGKTLLNGKGNVAILDLSTVTSVQDRVRGFKEALAKYPGIKIVADQDVDGAKRENAVPKATDILTAHPDVNLIFGINDPVALGALSALQQQNKSGISVVGFDAVNEAQNYIAQKGVLKADAIQYPHLIGAATIDAIVRSLNGENVPQTLPIPTGLVTAESFKK